MTFGYVISRIAITQPKVSILDWGGGVGLYFLFAKELFPALSIDYVVKDVTQLCAIGREIVPEITFFDDENAALSRTYDLVFASGSVQYTQDFYALATMLCAIARQSVMITRLPIVEESDDFVVLQRPYSSGYRTEIPGWFVNRKRFVHHIERQGFSLVREFMLEERPDVPNAPDHYRYAGFLFDRHPVEQDKARG
jgi:putative methyltransferase (TIGR04325 family)